MMIDTIYLPNVCTWLVARVVVRTWLKRLWHKFKFT